MAWHRMTRKHTGRGDAGGDNITTNDIPKDISLLYLTNTRGMEGGRDDHGCMLQERERERCRYPRPLSFIRRMNICTWSIMVPFADN